MNHQDMTGIHDTEEFNMFLFVTRLHEECDTRSHLAVVDHIHQPAAVAAAAAAAASEFVHSRQVEPAAVHNPASVAAVAAGRRHRAAVVEAEVAAAAAAVAVAAADHSLASVTGLGTHQAADQLQASHTNDFS